MLHLAEVIGSVFRRSNHRSRNSRTTHCDRCSVDATSAICCQSSFGQLPNELRKEVLIQLSRLQHVEAEIIQEIKDQLQQKLAFIRPTPYVDQEMGMNRLKSILEAGDEQMKVELCQAIQEANELNGPLRYWVKEQLNSVKKTNSTKESSQDSTDHRLLHRQHRIRKALRGSQVR